MNILSKENQELKNSKKPKSAVHDGHRNRMRERFCQNGFEGMHDHEILEMLLYYSVPRVDTNPLAHKLIDNFGTLRGVLEASLDQIQMVDGVTYNSAVLIKMILPLFNRYRVQLGEKKKINTIVECGKIFCDYYSGMTTERVTMMCIDSACKILAFEPVCDGDVASCVINCRRLVEIVLKYPTATAVIIAHNHPGGLALPSKDDVTSTNELVKLMQNMSISIIDHFIVAGDDYVSLASSVGFKNTFGANL